MTGTGAQVTIRPTLAIRVYVIAFLAVWIGLMVRMTIVHRHGSSVAAGALFLVVGLAMGYRLSRSGVTSTPDGTLVVRNTFGTRRIAAREIEDFRLGTSGGFRVGNQVIQVLLRDGTTYGLDVTTMPLRFGRKLNERRLEQLQAWHRSAV